MLGVNTSRNVVLVVIAGRRKIQEPMLSKLFRSVGVNIYYIEFESLNYIEFETHGLDLSVNTVTKLCFLNHILESLGYKWINPWCLQSRYLFEGLTPGSTVVI